MKCLSKLCVLSLKTQIAPGHQGDRTLNLVNEDLIKKYFGQNTLSQVGSKLTAFNGNRD
jgi:hypothetical protein